jgi:hypothetical protein
MSVPRQAFRPPNCCPTAALPRNQGAPATAPETTAIDFTDLMTEEERAVWAKKQKLPRR